jgi:hypothetical protein
MTASPATTSFSLCVGAGLQDDTWDILIDYYSALIY